MNLYRYNAEEERFPNIDDYQLASDKDRSSPHLLLYHLSDHPERDLVDTLPSLMGNPHTFALCFKGSMFAGLGDKRELVRKLQDQYTPRLHFLSAAMPLSGPSGTLLVRFQKFERHVKAASAYVDWAVVDPEIQENLLAVYLAMKALAATKPGSPSIREFMDSRIFKQILREAKEEYRLFQGYGGDLNWTVAEPAKAAGVAAQIWEQFRLRRI